MSEEKVLQLIRSRIDGIYPKEIESQPPSNISPRQARLIIQALVDSNKVKVDSDLKIRPHGASKNYRQRKACRAWRLKNGRSVRHRLNKAIQNWAKRLKINTSAVRTLLGCSMGDLEKYLQSNFLEGMSWDNWKYNGWHIDHIKPLKSEAKLEEKLHYTNLKPMWATFNIQRQNSEQLPEYINIAGHTYKRIT